MKVNLENFTPADIVDSVIRYLTNHSEAAINRLFAGTSPQYRAEWINRPIFQFWCHLDSANQKLLVQHAVDHYYDV